MWYWRLGFLGLHSSNQTSPSSIPTIYDRKWWVHPSSSENCSQIEGEVLVNKDLRSKKKGRIWSTQNWTTLGSSSRSTFWRGKSQRRWVRWCEGILFDLICTSQILFYLPSRERSHISPGCLGKSSTQICQKSGGCVNFLEGIYTTYHYVIVKIHMIVLIHTSYQPFHKFLEHSRTVRRYCHYKNTSS